MASVQKRISPFPGMSETKSARVEGMTCSACGMLVEPAMAFHPWLYCRLFKAGILDPAAFLQGQHFIPDPKHWGRDAPRRQREAARR